MSTHMQDQQGASNRETARAMGAAANVPGNSLGSAHLAMSAPGWAGVERFGMCRHLRKGGPQPMFGLIAMPPNLYCAKCVTDVAEAHSRRHPDTCDRCGGRSSSFREITLHAGPSAILIGHHCEDCYRIVAEG